MLNRVLSVREVKDREIMLKILYGIITSLEGEESIVAKRYAVRMKKELEDSDSIRRQRRQERQNRGGRYDDF